MKPTSLNHQKVAVIGFGYWGKKIYNTLLQLIPENSIRIVDPRLHTANQPRVTSLESILNDASISHVFIATPEETHYSIAKKCLEHNKHTFVEKPSTLFTQESEILQNLAKKNKITFYTDYIFLFDPFLKKIKDEIDSNIIGDILGVESIRHSVDISKPNITVFDDLAIHDIYIGKFLFEEMSSKLDVADIKIENNQIVQATVEYTINQLPFSAQYSWIQPETKRLFKVVGTTGTLIWDKDTPDIQIINNAGKIDTVSVNVTNSPLQLSIEYFFNLKKDSNNYSEDIAILEKIRSESSNLC